VALTALDDGGIAVWEYGATCPRLWAFSSDLSLRWERQLDASCSSNQRIGSAVSTPQGLVLLVLSWLTAIDLVSLQQ
jgi:hypothetical protein